MPVWVKDYGILRHQRDPAYRNVSQEVERAAGKWDEVTDQALFPKKLFNAIGIYVHFFLYSL